MQLYYLLVNKRNYIFYLEMFQLALSEQRKWQILDNRWLSTRHFALSILIKHINNTVHPKHNFFFFYIEIHIIQYTNMIKRYVFDE